MAKVIPPFCPLKCGGTVRCYRTVSCRACVQELSRGRKDPRLWVNNRQCPVCGKLANPSIYACETGMDYCSDEHARIHVNTKIEVEKR